MKTAEVYAALRERFSAPEWAIFFEVANGTGGHQRRYADAVAMNLFPSRGLEVNGFEVKVDRSDWYRELRNPQKAEDIYRYCDRWWLVVGDKEIVKDGELPVTWGLMAPRGKSLVVVKQAPKLTPIPIDRPFFAALARRSASAPAEEIEAIVRGRLEKELEWRTANDKKSIEAKNKEIELLRKSIDEFEKASGLRIAERWIRRYDPAELGRAVKFILSGGLRGITDAELDIIATKANAILNNVAEARSVIKAEIGAATTEA